MIFILAVGILGYILSNRKQFIKGLITIAVVGPITSYTLLKHPHLSGWMGMLYNWMAGTPQLVRIVRKKKVSGISEKGLFFATGAMILVISYGLIIHALPLIVGCIQGLLYMSVMMRYYYRYRKHD
jgi:uncharacterized protein with PQ loop repeat